MNYAPVIPNLECAKLCAYYRKKKEITILAPILEPTLYSRFIVRKDYDDDVHDKRIFAKNVEYGGLAFSNNYYSPLPLEIESTRPEFYSYERYKKKFVKVKSSEGNFKKIINGEHLRLSLDNKTLWKDYLKQVSFRQNTNSIFIHDYDVGVIPNSLEVIKELSSRYSLIKREFNPRYIGTKFPIQLYSDEVFRKWFDIAPSFELFFIQYNGVMKDESIVELCEKNSTLAKQLHYNIGLARFSEEEFMVRLLPKIFKQVLFLRSHNIKILLKYDDGFLVDQRIKNLIRLFNNYLRRPNFDEKAALFSGTLFKFVSSKKMKQYQFAPNTMKLPDIRDCFQYVREKNYDVFKMFYENEKVNYKGGEFYV